MRPFLPARWSALAAIGVALPLIAACARSTPRSVTTVPMTGACAASFTAIPAIQGRGNVSPLTGTTVTTQGVVVGDFEGPAPALRGFYLQAAAGDGDPETSDGLFVLNGDADSVALGDVVRVTGVVAEVDAQTRLTDLVSMTRCARGATVAPADLTLPFPADASLERFEGMRVRFPQTLTITEHFQLGRFGTVVLSSGGRLWQSTERFAPGAEATALQAANARNRLMLDDATNAQNPEPIAFGRGGAPLSAANPLRAGDQVTGLVGVLTQTWGGQASSPVAYRVRPASAAAASAPVFTATNARRPAPESVGGTLRVSAFNVLNYYNNFGTMACTMGDGGETADCRGAPNAADFERQAEKIVAAIRALDADILGLMEIENDGYGPASAIVDLVRRLNAATAPGTFAFIDADARTGTRNALGTDGIKVGLLYKPARVTPTGRTAALATASFVTGGDTRPRQRPSLVQAFVQPDGGRLVVSVNHLKSKSGACDAPDARDGQGACNTVRTNAARELATWLATDPTGTGDPDVLLIGDLNAYAKEDPVTTLMARGFVDLETTRVRGEHYSLSASMASGAVSTTRWPRRRWPARSPESPPGTSTPMNRRCSATSQRSRVPRSVRRCTHPIRSAAPTMIRWSWGSRSGSDCLTSPRPPAARTPRTSRRSAPRSSRRRRRSRCTACRSPCTWTASRCPPPATSPATARAPVALVERADLVVVRRGGDDQQPVLGDDRAAVAVGARVADSLGRQLRILAERNRPARLARVQVDRVERAPRRLDARISLVVEEDVEERRAVRQRVRDSVPTVFTDESLPVTR